MFVPGKPFLPSVMFASKARAYPGEATFRFSTLVKAPGLTRKHLIRMEKLARDKRSSLSQTFVTYVRKKFYNIGHRCQSHKTNFFEKT